MFKEPCGEWTCTLACRKSRWVVDPGLSGLSSWKFQGYLGEFSALPEERFVVLFSFFFFFSFFFLGVLLKFFTFLPRSGLRC